MLAIAVAQQIKMGLKMGYDLFLFPARAPGGVCEAQKIINNNGGLNE